MPEMTANAAPPGRWHWAMLALGWLALAVYFHSPVREIMSVSLDGSNYASYAYFTAHGFQYGPDVVPMAGPYGFVLYGWVYSGQLFWIRTACELTLNGALAALTLWFFVQLRGSGWRWVWLAAHIAFTPFIEDLPIEWNLLLAGLFLLQTPRPGRGGWTLAVCALLAFLSLIKGTQLVLGLATLGVVLGGHAAMRRGRQVALVAGGYFGALLLWWLLAGQNLLHLPAYVRGILELTSGYNDAMSLEEPTRVFLRGLVVSLGLLAILGLALWRVRRNFVAVAALALLAGHSFVQWKHGFVRADGHAYIYFHYAIVAALTIHLVARQAVPAASRATIAGAVAVLLVTLTLSSYGTEEWMLPNWRGAPAKACQRLTNNYRHLRALPVVRAGFEQQLAVQRRLYAMPLTRAAVGAGTIDLFGFEHGRLTLNGLAYHPRPMGGGSFNAYTPGLMQLNREFLRDPARRPDFYLAKLQTIDERLLAQDDGLALLDLIRLYRPVLMEQDHLLLWAVPGATPAEPRRVARQTFQLGDTVSLPAIGANEMLLARFDLKPSWLGRLRAALYKVPRLRIALRGPGIPEPDSHRLIPAMAASPFLLSPMVESTRDLLELYQTVSSKTPREFRVSTTDRTWFNKTVHVEFLAVPRPAAPKDNSVTELLRFTETSMETVITTLAGQGTPVTLNGQLVHPPAHFSWALPDHGQQISFGYGLVPDAYAGDHETDGVEFILSVLSPGRPPREIFRRLLSPRSRPEDGGHHLATLPLPMLPAGSRLELRTTPGPVDNSAYDWAYVSDLQFLPPVTTTP